ncbi:hypothetical protein VTI74DRAFT_8961 [Chaetomium olivicolor]
MNALFPNGLNANAAGSLADGSYKTTYLITGASRGIGKALVAALLLRPSHTVIACVRNVASQSADLQSLPKADSSNLVSVKLDCASETDHFAAAQELRSQHGITHIDVVIANAAIADNFGPASTMQIEHLKNHMMVNAYSVLLLFQATHALLRAAKAPPKFVLMGAPLGSITSMAQFSRAPVSAYCVSKLAANYLVRKVHYENKWLVAFVVDPGHVQTDMGAAAARLMGRDEAPTTLKESVDGILARIDEATKEGSSGKFLLHEDGSELPW